MDTTFCERDAMQVCRNGHIITDRLFRCPDQRLSRCDRCGADTVEQCGTCGQPIPGAGSDAGLWTVGRPTLPTCCACCGAAFPWAAERPAGPDDPLPLLEQVVRRLPRVATAFRSRHGQRPALAVRDEFDLEDLVRSVLPLFADEVRPESRTPRYAAATRTDLLLPEQRVAVVVKWAGPDVGDQWAEDLQYYQRRGYPQLLGVVWDVLGSLPDPRALERAWSQPAGEPRLRVVILA